MMSCNYISVISGWFSTKEPRNYITHGHEIIRSSDFRVIWNKSLQESIKPNSITVIDSNSPVKLDLNLENSDLKLVELGTNLGHAQQCKSLLCGYTIGVITGLLIEYSSAADYVIYVEQDTLIKGNFREYIDELPPSTKFQFGDGYNCPQPLQVSLMIFRRDAIPKFCAKVLSIKSSDKLVTPELKFLYASSSGWRSILLRILIGLLLVRVPYLNSLIQRIIRLYSIILYPKNQLLNFGYGRRRPINFDDNLLHFQHASKEELEKYIKRVKIH